METAVAGAGPATSPGPRSAGDAVPRPSSTGPAPRLSSLDAARGAMLVVSVVSDSLLAPPEWFEHAAWRGVHPLDLVFPVFVTLSGAGLALAHRRGVRAARLVRRVLVLLAAGLAYNAALGALRTGHPLTGADLHVLRWTGVLPLYAVVVLVIALGHLLTRTWRGWALVALGLAAAHTALLVAWQQRCPGGVLTPACNPSRTLDAAVLPVRHLYGAMALGHDPEGLVGVLGACASAAAGAALAHALLAHARLAARTGSRHTSGPATPAQAPAPPAALPVLLGLAAVLAGAALAASTLVPTMKRLWTAPFGLGIAAGVVVGVLALHLLLDRSGTGRALRGLRWPLVALGRNSLLVYFGSHVLMAALVTLPHDRPPVLAQRTAEALAVVLPSWVGPQMAFSGVVLAGWLALASLLHRYRVYVRA